MRSLPSIKYLVLVLNNKHVKLFEADETNFTNLKFSMPDHIAAYRNDMPGKVANFSDESDRKEVMLDKFVHHVDNGLTEVLKTHRLPVFILGTERAIGHFKKHSRNASHIAGYKNGNYDNATTFELREALQDVIASWYKKRENEALQLLDKAVGANKVSAGIQQVWRTANEKLGRILLVERNFVSPAEITGDGDAVRQRDSAPETAPVTDAVDDIIEKVTKCGGEVIFVNDGCLDKFMHIALIQYY